MIPIPPFSHQNALTLSDDEIDDLQVDREDELATSVSSLARSYENLLLYGNRGVGKTFLVKLLSHKLETDYPDLLPVYVNVAGLPMYNPGDIVAAFSRAVLLQLCVAVWKSVLQKDYLDLRDEVSASDAAIHVGGRPERIVRRIFSLLMTSQRVARTEIGNSIGFSAGVKGEKRDSYARQKLESEILPFEFAELVDELIGRVLAPHGKTRIVALCDDANRLPMFSQEEILTRYFELFRAKKVQFLFVAAWQQWEKERRVPLCFETVLEIKGFTDITVFTEFMTKAARGAIAFDADALRHIHEVTKGEAVSALHIGDICWRRLERSEEKTVNLAIARESADIYRMKREYATREIRNQKDC